MGVHKSAYFAAIDLVRRCAHTSDGEMGRLDAEVCGDEGPGLVEARAMALELAGLMVGVLRERTGDDALVDAVLDGLDMRGLELQQED